MMIRDGRLGVEIDEINSVCEKVCLFLSVASVLNQPGRRQPGLRAVIGMV